MRRLLIAASIVGLAPLLLGAAPLIQPGQWEIHSQITDVKMPGAPPQVAAMMKTGTTVKYCVTPEQAAQGPRDMLNQRNKECTFTKYNMTGNSIDAVMQCHGRSAMKMTIKGSFTPTSYSTTAHMEMSGAQSMTMTSTGTGKLIGPCKK